MIWGYHYFWKHPHIDQLNFQRSLSLQWWAFDKNFPPTLGPLEIHQKKVSLIAFLATFWGTISRFATTDVCLGINWINKLFPHMFLGGTMFHTWFSTTTRRHKMVTSLCYLILVSHTAWAWPNMCHCSWNPETLKTSTISMQVENPQLGSYSQKPQPKALTVVAAVARFTSSSLSRGEAESAPSCQKRHNFKSRRGDRIIPGRGLHGYVVKKPWWLLFLPVFPGVGVVGPRTQIKTNFMAYEWWWSWQLTNWDDLLK